MTVATSSRSSTFGKVTPPPVLSWPKLVKIRGLAPSSVLTRYQTQGGGMQLFSSRSEPWLGSALGRSWRNPERWV